jgi:hypothetical protein
MRVPSSFRRRPESIRAPFLLLAEREWTLTFVRVTEKSRGGDERASAPYLLVA